MTGTPRSGKTATTVAATRKVHIRSRADLTTSGAGGTDGTFSILFEGLEILRNGEASRLSPVSPVSSSDTISSNELH